MTVDDLVRDATSIDPGFAASLRGAREDEIRALETAVGLPLPASYRDFLRLMGHGTGWITIGYDTTTDVSRVTEFYRDYVRTGTEMVPDGCIAISVLGVDLNVCLDVRGEGEPSVVFSEANQIYRPYADSLPGLLFRLAFFHYMPVRHRAVQKYWKADRASALPKARDVAGALGFTPLWFSDDVAWCGERPGVSVGIRQLQDEGILVAVAADHEVDVVRTGEAFVREIGVRPER